MTRLTDTQLVLLSKASQREDHAVEVPLKLRGAAAQHVIAPLLDRCILEEILATTQMPVWRRDGEDQAVALVITPAGLEAIGLGEDSGEIPVHPCNLTLAEGNREDEYDTNRKPRETRGLNPRAGSKQARVIALLSREGGASIEDLTAETGWLPHTVRAELTRLRKRGFRLEKTRVEDRPTVYRIIETEPTEQTKPDDVGGFAEQEG